MIYKILPGTPISWRDVFIGAVITALLFIIGNYLLGIYLGKANLNSVYSGAGSLVIILVWVYYSAQIFFLGAEFTNIYAKKLGSHCEK